MEACAASRHQAVGCRVSPRGFKMDMPLAMDGGVLISGMIYLGVPISVPFA